MGLLSMYCTVHIRLFFIFWIRANLFRDFSGCRRMIFKCFNIIRFVFPLAFQRRIVLLRKLAKLQQKENGKSNTMSRLFFSFWIHANLFQDLSGCRGPIFKYFYIIRFIFSLAFQRHILNCYTTKTRQATAKTRHKVKNDGEGGEVYDKIFWSAQYSFITHKNQVLVLILCHSWAQLT